MKSLYESILTESIFSAPKPENIKNLMFLDVLKKMMTGKIFSPNNLFDDMKSNSYYDEKTASMHIGFENQSPQFININGGLSDIYKIGADNGLIINNIIFDNFTGRIYIIGDVKTYDGRNKISKISSKIPMSLSLFDGEFKNMDFSEMKLITSRSRYASESACNIYNSTLSNINLGSHPKNPLYIYISSNTHNSSLLLFDNVTGEFRDIYVTINTYNSPRYDKKLSEACFVDFDPSIPHYDGDTVKINPDILMNLGLDKLKCKKMNIELAINHKKNGYFLITAADGTIKSTKCEFMLSR